MLGARLVLTDSGGIQEETTALGVPRLTLRDNTERPITCALGTNRLVGTRKETIVGAAEEVLGNPPRPTQIPEKWDGRSAERLVSVLIDSFRCG
jgi:UDP-N-acetylglucosamine 2-epimerase (non-hydrolysing)